jgi:type I restriction enzyme S subunit
MNTTTESISPSLIGEVPQDWEIVRIRRITQEHKQGYYTEQPYVEEGVKLVRITDIDDFSNISFENMPFVAISLKDEKEFKVKENDFLFARSGTIGRFGLIRNPERSVFASYLIRFRFLGADPEFLRFVFSSYFFKEGLVSTLHGGANKNIHAENIKEQLIAIPQHELQINIAHFLDRKTAAIDTLIAKKQRLIQLLEEKRTALINQAVTKGLNPNVPMKDSGIPWIGEIPEHWEVKRVKAVINFITSGSRGWAEYYIDNEEDPIFLQSGNLGNQMQLRFEGVQHARPPKGSEGERAIVKQGDILVCMTGARTGNVAVVREALSEAYINQHLSIVRPINSKVDSCFLGYALKSEVSFSQFLMSQYGGTKQGLGLEDVKDTFFVYPPLPEQEKIVGFLDTRNLKTNHAIRKLELQIEKLQEYRRSLITAAVTGKLEIHNLNQET